MFVPVDAQGLWLFLVTRGGPGGRDRTLAAKRRKNAQNQIFFVKKNDMKIKKNNISSSYAKILGDTNFQPREIPRSKRRREKREQAGAELCQAQDKFS